MPVTYNYWLVGLSLGVAVLLSYTSLGLAGRVAQGDRTTARAWLIAGALAMGSGIWSMHFIGMLSMNLPIQLRYDPGLTALSLLAAVLASGLSIAIASRPALAWPHHVLGSTAIAGGIVAMHYVGMAAIRVSPAVSHDPLLVTLSILIALVTSFAAVGLAFRVRSRSVPVTRAAKLVAALVLGLAIAGMHYCGMAAVTFPTGAICSGGVAANPYWFAATIAAITIVLLTMTLLASLLDAQLRIRQQLHARRLELAQSRVDFHVTHDALTELPNRQRFVALLNQRLQRDTGHEDPVAVLLVDLDRFKNINDSLGHSVGDGVLQQVAQRLLGLVSERGFVARMGADEFLVMDQLAGGREVLHLAERIVRSLGAVYLVQSLELHLAASVGATTYPFDHAPAEVLISHADEAMYDAKRDGGNALRFFVPGTTVHTLDRLQLENDLWHAAERGQLVVHYQPKVGIADARIVGFEALARWLHPVRGWIPPADFIPLAETSDVIQHIGQWILEQACRQLAIWHASGFGGLQIAVNLSARQFRQQSLVSSIDTALERHGLEPHHLELEVTESMVMTDFERARETLRRLSERGLRIAVDDFGTGHSSLSYLKKLPITGLKIDRSFVADLGRDTASDALVRAIVTLGQGLGMQTIAEGVETRHQLACLQSFGCDLYQGYLYSRPCTAVDALALLHRAPVPAAEGSLTSALLERLG